MNCALFVIRHPKYITLTIVQAQTRSVKALVVFGSRNR